jgi:hypothetical protein
MISHRIQEERTLKKAVLTAVAVVMFGAVSSQAYIPPEDATIGKNRVRDATVRPTARDAKRKALHLSYVDGKKNTCPLDGTTDIVVSQDGRLNGTWARYIPADREGGRRAACLIVVRTKDAEELWNRILTQNGLDDVVPLVLSR